MNDTASAAEGRNSLIERSFDLPFGYRATFIWRRPDEPFEVCWSPDLPRIRKPGPQRKFLAGRFSTSSGAKWVDSKPTGFSTSREGILQQNQAPFSALIGPTDPPINLLRGHKHPGAPVLDRELRRAIIEAEVGQRDDDDAAARSMRWRAV